ncbi:MAG: 4Fe-4S dicluster domain-containing protein [Chloroflexi bacterium]|nr:4Fe-4S dicluster domain-containing protein [Chloroflexota bacterium]
MNLEQLEAALMPYEKRLREQERFRRWLGVKEVDSPTYERYITGPVEQFDRRKDAFNLLLPDNPFGEETRQRFKARTGSESRAPLPYHELDIGARIGQSLTQATWRLCRDYHPPTLPVTPPEGRLEVTDRAWMSRLVKKAALFYGAEAVRIARIDRRWVYKDIDVPYEYAVIAVVSHVREFIKSAPSHMSSAAVPDTYSRLKVITTQLADFICGLGYEAAYHESVGPDSKLNLVPIAIDAGVGEFARTGRVLSPEFGINMRIQAVMTNLPLQADRPISFGVHDFCMACESCATYCPANAVPFGPPTEQPLGIYNNPGFRKWYINAERCLTFWSANKKEWTSCGGRCISVCPWNKPQVPFHNLARWLAVHSPGAVKKALVSADQRMYKRTHKIKKG